MGRETPKMVMEPVLMNQCFHEFKGGMILRHVLLLGAAAFAAAMAACTASSYSGLPFGPQPPPPVVTTFNVPASDTEPAASGTTWDVLSVQTSRTGPAGSASSTNI